MNFKAVIFDMDGLLIDSELYWIQAESDFLKQYNIVRTPELAAKMMGQSLRGSVEIICRDFNLPYPIEDVMQKKLEATESIYTTYSQPMSGAKELLTTVRGQLKTAIASGSALPRIEKIVDRFDWRQYFDELISADHVNFVGKPDPAIYRYTSKVLGLAPDECVVLEDSVNGLRAAHGAGMQCIAVPDARWSHGDFSAANLVAESLQDKKIFDFLGV